MASNSPHMPPSPGGPFRSTDAQPELAKPVRPYDPCLGDGHGRLRSPVWQSNCQSGRADVRTHSRGTDGDGRAPDCGSRLADAGTVDHSGSVTCRRCARDGYRWEPDAPPRTRRGLQRPELHGQRAVRCWPSPGTRPPTGCWFRIRPAAARRPGSRRPRAIPSSTAARRRFRRCRSRRSIRRCRPTSATAPSIRCASCRRT